MNGISPALSEAGTSGQAWYLNRSLLSSVQVSTLLGGFEHVPWPRLYEKVMGPRKGHATGGASSRNMEYSNASPVIYEQRDAREFLLWQ